jgi:redox-sensitive bicupin YhaK (pirin superfamily)
MSESFDLHATSASSAKVADVWLDPPADPNSVNTRKVVRSELVDNVHSTDARVKITIVHQRRHSQKEPWQDYETFNLATLKAGQEMKCYLSAAETFHLYQILEQLHAIGDAGIPKGDRKLAVVDEATAVVVRGRAAELVRRMCRESPEEFWMAVRARRITWNNGGRRKGK